MSEIGGAAVKLAGHTPSKSLAEEYRKHLRSDILMQPHHYFPPLRMADAEMQGPLDGSDGIRHRYRLPLTDRQSPLARRGLGRLDDAQ